MKKRNNHKSDWPAPTMAISHLTFLLLTLLTACSAPKPVSTMNTPTAEPLASPELHYTLSGTGPITLVFVHGWCINGEYWNQQMERFKNRYQVLTLDLAGHGESPKIHGTMTMANYADGVIRLLKKLQIDNIILVGHSMSGNINLRVYQKMADKVIGFIGVDNFQVVGHQPSQPEMEQFTQIMNELRKDYKGSVREFAESGLFHPATDSAVRNRVIADVANTDPTLSISTLESLSMEYRYEQEMLPEMSVPLLVVATEQSIHSDSSLKQFCPNGYKFWAIKNSGHYPMIEQPEEFNHLLNEAIEYAILHSHSGDK